MANIHKFTENVRSRFGAISTDLGAEGSDTIVSAEFVNMANYDLVVGIAQAVGIAAGSTISLVMWQATATDGSDSKTVTGATDTFVSTNVTDTDVLVAQVRGEDLDVASSFQYVGFKISSDETDGSQEVAGKTKICTGYNACLILSG